MHKKTVDNLSGFTLVEILIAIAILALLSAISILGYQQYTINSAQKILLSDTKNCLNICVAKLADTETPCTQSDCQISKYTASCTPDLAGPVYVTCTGKDIINGYTCSVYQSGQISCS